MLGRYPVTLPDDRVVWLTPEDYAAYLMLLTQKFWGLTF